MAIATNTYTTYDNSASLREDLIDVITNISPMDTWFTSNSGTTKATGRYHEWLTDALAAAAANAQIEGDDAMAATAITAPTRTGNYCQILRKVFQITDTDEAVDKAGRDSEVAYQTAKNLKELARDIEYALICNTASASGATGTARQLKGVSGWITTNTASASATGLDLTAALLNSTLQTIWAAGGYPRTLLVGGYNKRIIDAFSTNTREISAESKTLVAAVDIYKSSFGDLAVRLHQQVNTTYPGTVLILGDMELWNKAWLRPVKKMQLAKTGDNTKFHIAAELTLESRQEKGSGAITNTKSS